MPISALHYGYKLPGLPLLSAFVPLAPLLPVLGFPPLPAMSDPALALLPGVATGGLATLLPGNESCCGCPTGCLGSRLPLLVAPGAAAGCGVFGVAFPLEEPGPGV